MTFNLHTRMMKWQAWNRLSATQLIRSASVLLILWSVYSLVQLVWWMVAPKAQVMPAAGNPDLAMASDVQQSDTMLTDSELAQLQRIELFGSIEIAPQETKITMNSVTDEELNAKTTALDLKLLGLVYSPDQSRTLAIIAHKNRQDQYRVGGELPVTGRVELARVFHNRVVIDNNGRYEALWLYDEEQKSSPIAKRLPESGAENEAPRPANAPNGKPTQSETASAIANNYRQRLYRDPASLADAIQVSPVRHNGEMIGYRVSPGQNPEEFAQLGLMPNDIVTSVNDIQLNGPINAFRLYQLMKEASEANVRVKRGDQSLELMLSLDGGNS